MGEEEDMYETVVEVEGWSLDGYATYQVSGVLD